MFSAYVQKLYRTPRRAILGGTTAVTYANVGPDWKFTVIGELELNTLNRSQRTRRDDGRQTGNTCSHADSPRGLPRSAVTQRLDPQSHRASCLKGGPPSGSTARNMFVRWSRMPILLWTNAPSWMPHGIRYVPLKFPAHFHVSSNARSGRHSDRHRRAVQPR